jgi:Fur family ferric uptake transcriptional regulator
MQQRQELRKAGLKITLPRLKILEILERAESRHLSAEDIYKYLLESGEVIEFVDEDIERLQHAIAEQYGYELLDHSLVLYVKQKTDAADSDDS